MGLMLDDTKKFVLHRYFTWTELGGGLTRKIMKTAMEYLRIILVFSTYVLLENFGKYPQ